MKYIGKLDSAFDKNNPTTLRQIYPIVKSLHYNDLEKKKKKCLEFLIAKIEFVILELAGTVRQDDSHI